MKKASPSFVTHTGSNPKIDIVLPKGHSWFVRGGYVQALRHFNCLGHVFTVSEKQSNEDLLSYLKNPKCDAIFLMNTDWHAQYLHKTEDLRQLWRNIKAPKILFSFECMNNPAIRLNKWWWSDTISAVQRTMACVDGVVYAHEIDTELFKVFGLPILWQPFAIDEEIFPEPKEYTSRKAAAYFRGKATPFYQQSTYRSRRKLMELLTANPRTRILDSYEYDDYDESDKATLTRNKQFIQEMSEYQISLALPSLSPTMVVRPFEGMASGCVVLQNKIAGEQTRKLFEDGKHLIMYDENNPEGLIQIISDVLDNPEMGKAIARNGHEEVLDKHTIKHRVQAVLEWINQTNFGGEEPQHPTTFSG